MPSNFLSSLGGLFEDSQSDYAAPKPAFSIPPMVDIPGLDAATTSSIEDVRAQRQPLLERRNKLMEQLYQPDHLSYGSMIGQALTAFLPVLLGKAMAGNAGGAAGAVAGAQGLKTWGALSDKQKQDEQRSGLANINSLDAEIKGNVDLEKTLREGGLKRQGKMEDVALEQSQFLPGSPRYNFEMAKMSAQHKNRMGEMAYAKSLSADESKTKAKSAADPALIESTKYAIQQRFGKDSEEAKTFGNLLNSDISERSIEEMRRQLGLGDPEKRALGLEQPGRQALYNNVIKPAKQKLDDEYNSLASLKMMVNNKSGVLVGALRGQWATSVAGEGARKTDDDINRNLTPNAWSKIKEIENYFNDAPEDSPLSPRYKELINDVLAEIGAIHLQKYANLDRELETLAPGLAKYANQNDPNFYSNWTAPGKERAQRLFGYSGKRDTVNQNNSMPAISEDAIQKRILENRQKRAQGIQ